MTWLIASTLFIILLLVIITWLCATMVAMGNEIGRLGSEAYKSSSQMNSVICQLTQRKIAIKGIWSDTVILEDEE